MSDTLEALRARKSAREEARAAEALKQEEEELLLEEKLEVKLGGRRGVAFEIINTEVGLFAVRKPPFVVAKKFNSLPADQRHDEEVIKFVSPCVEFPEQDVFRATIIEHGGIAWKCALALLNMYEAKRSERLGK